VASWGQWIKDTVQYAAQPSLGNYDPPGWVSGRSTDIAYNGPVGGACGLPGCPSNICINTGTDLGEYCSRKCDEVSTCPGGFECDADLGLCADAPKPPDSSSGTGPSIDASPGAIGITRASAGGCSLSPGPDPTTPIPWKTAALFAVALGALGRRRRR